MDINKQQQIELKKLELRELELRELELRELESNPDSINSDFIFYEPSLIDLIEAEECAEIGFTKLIVKMTSGQILLDTFSKSWYRYEDGWKRYNNQALISDLLTSLGMSYKDAQVEDVATKKQFMSAARSLFCKKTRDAVRSNIVKDQLLSAVFDEKEHLVQLTDCVLNTNQLRVRDKSPNLLLSKKMPIKFNSKANCPLFLKFMDELFDYDKDVIEYVQRMFGSCLKAIPKKVLPIFWGSANNGKSTLFEVMKMLFGEYSCTVMGDTILSGKNISTSHRGASYLKMQGRRLVFISETGENNKVDASALKMITGADTVPMRKLYSNDLEDIKPTWTIFLGTNHPPFLQNDPALFARIRLIEMKNSFVRVPDPNDSHQFPVDLGIKSKIFAEREGILNWLIQGCENFVDKGLSIPKAIEASTQAYQEDSDYLAQYLEEKGLVINGILQAYRETCPELHKSFRAWQIDGGLMPYTPHRVKKEMIQKGYFLKKSHGNRYYIKDKG